MVHLNVFSPVRKLQFMSKFILRTSKRMLKHTGASSLPIPDTSHITPPTVNVSYLIKEDLFNGPQEGLAHDIKYYESDSEGGFCIFRAEDTLFKVINQSRRYFISFCSASYQGPSMLSLARAISLWRYV